MVQYSEQVHRFEASIHALALAHNLRFPSPHSDHVLSSDVISRVFAGSTIHTTRLILKRGKMPVWAPRGLVERSTSWVVEESLVDLEGPEDRRRLFTRSRNIDHKVAMEVYEWQTFKPVPEDPSMTEAITLTRVTSQFSFWPLRHRVEKFGIGRVPKSSEKARAGLALAVSLLLPPSTQIETFLTSGPLRPFPFEPLPSSLALASELVRNKLKEARKEKERRAREREMSDEVVWRKRWRAAAGRGVTRFRSNVCALTGLMCDKKCLE